MEPNKSWVLNDDNLMLRQKTSLLNLPIDAKDQELINRMVAYIDACYDGSAVKYDIRIGIALAGPQVGLMKSVIYLHFN
jgi:peptide deformylase